MPVFTVEEMTLDIDPDAGHLYLEECPHGCADGACEGHLEDRDRLFAVTNLFDRHDGEGAGYFSEARAKLIAEFMEATNGN